MGGVPQNFLGSWIAPSSAVSAARSSGPAQYHTKRTIRTCMTVQNGTKGTPRRMMKRKRSEGLSQSANKRVMILLSIYKVVGANGLFACDSGGWDVTPSEAYSWSYAPPQGCSCEETGVPLADCKVGVASEGRQVT